MPSWVLLVRNLEVDICTREVFHQRLRLMQEARLQAHLTFELLKLAKTLRVLRQDQQMIHTFAILVGQVFALLYRLYRLK